MRDRVWDFSSLQNRHKIAFHKILLYLLCADLATCGISIATTIISIFQRRKKENAEISRGCGGGL